MGRDNLYRHLVERYPGRNRKHKQQPYVQVPVLSNQAPAASNQEQDSGPFYGTDGESGSETDQTDDIETIDMVSLGSGPDSPVAKKQQASAAQNDLGYGSGGRGSLAQPEDGDHTDEDVLDMWLKPSTTASLSEQQAHSH